MLQCFAQVNFHQHDCDYVYLIPELSEQKVKEDILVVVVVEVLELEFVPLPGRQACPSTSR